MSHRDEYIKNVTAQYRDVKLAILADIAWSVHNIAAMLMEYNDYTYPYEYLNGKDVNGGDDNECVSE